MRPSLSFLQLLNQEVRKMTSANIPAPVPVPDVGDPDLVRDTDDRRADLGVGLIRGAGGGPRAHEGGGPTPGIETVALDLGTGGRRKSPRKDPRLPQKATAVPGGLGALVGGTGEVAVLLGPLREGSPGLRLLDATRKKKRRTRTARRNGTETGERTGTGAETNENAPPVRRKRAKIKNEIGTASPTARKEMLR